MGLREVKLIGNGGRRMCVNVTAHLGFILAVKFQTLRRAAYVARMQGRINVYGITRCKAHGMPVIGAACYLCYRIVLSFNRRTLKHCKLALNLCVVCPLVSRCGGERCVCMGGVAWLLPHPSDTHNGFRRLLKDAYLLSVEWNYGCDVLTAVKMLELRTVVGWHWTE